MLADDHARHSLEHFTRAPHGSNLQLLGGDGTLARGSGDTDKVLGWILDVRQVAKRPRCGNHDIGIEREGEHDVGHHRGRAGHCDSPPKHAEIEQSICELAWTSRHVLEAIPTLIVGRRAEFGRVHDEVDRDAGENGACLIEDPTSDTARRLRGHPGHEKQQQSGEGRCCSEGLVPHLNPPLRAVPSFGLSASTAPGVATRS